MTLVHARLHTHTRTHKGVQKDMGTDTAVTSWTQNLERFLNSFCFCVFSNLF